MTTLSAVKILALSPLHPGQESEEPISWNHIFRQARHLDHVSPVGPSW